MKYWKIIHSFLCITGFFCILQVSAQSPVLNLKVHVETCDGKTDPIEITWKATRKPAPLILDPNGDFSLELDFNESYLFTIFREGCKKMVLRVNTSISNKKWDEGVNDIQTAIFLPDDGGTPGTVLANIAFNIQEDDYMYTEPYMRTLKLQKAHYAKEAAALVAVAETDSVTEVFVPEPDTLENLPVESPVDTLAIVPADTVITDVPDTSAAISRVNPVVLAEIRSKYNIVFFETEEERKKVMDTGERAAFTGNIFVILKRYDELEKLNSDHFGFINFGNGSGNIEVSQVEFERYKKVFNK